MKIITHIHTDLDSVSSSWLYSKFIAKNKDIQYGYVPANYDLNNNEIEQVQMGELVCLDIACGIKGERSCFETISEKLSEEEQSVLKDLTYYISEQDTSGKTGDRFGLSTMVAAFRNMYNDDNIIREKMFEIFDGIYMLLVKSKESEKLYEKVEWYTKDIAICDNFDTKSLIGKIFSNGAKFIIYRNGNDIGITRSANYKDYDLQRLKNKIHEGGWFFHPSGFLAAKGTYKAPATTASIYTPQKLAEILINDLQQIIDCLPDG